MSSEGFRGKEKQYDLSFVSIYRIFLLFFIPFVAYSLSALPSIVTFIIFLRVINFSNPIHVLLIPFVVMFEFLLFNFEAVAINGLFLKALNLKPKEGEYPISLKNKTFFKISVFYVLYRPVLKLLAILNMQPLRKRFLRFGGLKIGDSTIVPGSETVTDPYVTEIGEQTLLGGYCYLSAHLIDNDKLILKKIKIGDNCLIGSFTLILPGVVIKDNVSLGAYSLVTKNKILKKGKSYGGIPAKIIKKSTKKKKK